MAALAACAMLTGATDAPGDIKRAFKLLRTARIDGVFTDNPGAIKGL